MLLRDCDDSNMDDMFLHEQVFQEERSSDVSLLDDENIFDIS